MKRLTRLLAALTAALLLLPCVAFALTDVVQVRTVRASRSAKRRAERPVKITMIPTDTYLPVHDKVGDWYYVEYDGQYGYVAAGDRWTVAVAWDENKDGSGEDTDLKNAWARAA